MDHQQNLHEITDAAALLAWQDPGIAIRAERIAALGQWLDLIKNDRGPRAKFTCDALKAEIERVNKFTDAVRPLETARDEARAAYAAALKAITSATAWIAAATSDDEHDLAELALKKAQRAANTAAVALRAALQDQPPPGTPGGLDLSAAAMFAAREDTRQLAALASELASYQHAGCEPNVVRVAVAQGRAASGAALWAIAEHGIRDPAARQLLDLRWSVACQVLGIECDRRELDLPLPAVAAE